MNKITVAIDCDGGDFAPKEQIIATIKAIKDYNVNAYLLGDKNKIEEVLLQNDYAKHSIKVIHTEEKIDNEDSPVKAIRHKKNSSIVKGINLLKEKKADAFISSGSTGGVLSAGILLDGRIKGVNRPALTTVIPTTKTGAVLLDLGANAQVKPENLNEFATFGSIYAEKFLKISSPKVGLLNIGTEENKGTEIIQQAYKLLKENQYVNFTGNIEARDILTGKCDVIVADGFSGNIALKSIEGTAITLLKELKMALMSSTKSKIGALLSKSAFKKVKKMLDYEEYGGACLLGINDIVIKAHGSSNAKAFYNAIRQAIIVKESGVVDEIKKLTEEK